MPSFQLSHLDHVAIHSVNPSASVKWYQEVLGLKKYQLEEWGDFPIFLLSGKVGVAIFPAKQPKPVVARKDKTAHINHFAFNVSNENFAAARQHYEALGLFYSFQDHHYFHSIYTKDPDGHTVELTTQVLEDELIYG
jgi:catechol 2,3-dioxygenase-like lactoylglutathione lyase family enzyme